MYRLLKPKNIHRALIGLILFAPLAYLFATQISALAGAHGEEVIAQEPYQEEWIETDSFSGTHEYKFVISLTTYASSSKTWSFNFYVENYEHNPCSVLIFDNTDQWLRYRVTSADGASSTLVRFDWSNKLQWEDSNIIYFDSSSLPSSDLINYGTLFYRNEVATPNYFDSLFGDMFGKSNFLTEWGEDALSENRHGFAPVGELFKYVDDNMLHLSDKQIGKMGYGYMYYVVHVLIFDIVAMAFVFIVTIPQKVMNMLNEKTGGDI